MTAQTRGIRNNNPGNIEHGANWQGLAPADQQWDERFCTFSAPKYGIRAIARILITYYDHRVAADGSRIDTVQEIVDRWAPPVENNSAAYGQHLRDALGVERGQIINVHDYDTMKTLVETIILHENGVQPYTDAQITQGLVLAGVEPAGRESLRGSRTVQGGALAMVTASVAGISDIVDQVAPAVGTVRQVLDVVPLWAIAAVAVVGIGYMLYARWDDRRKGLR